MPDFDPIELLEGLPDPVLAVDRGGRVAYVNAEAERLLAWPRADLVGRTLGEVVTGGGAASARVRRKDGAELAVDLLETRSGSMRVLFLRRIHEHPEVPPHERYRLVFEHAPVGLLHWDAQGVCTGCNDEVLRIIGSTRSLVIGLDLLSLRGHPTRERFAHTIRETLQGQTRRWEGPYTSQTANKTTEVSALFAPIRGPRGEVLGGLGILEDVTERKSIHTQLARADRIASIGTLAAGVAHEINNPLVYVTLGLELIERELSRLRQAARAPSDEDWDRVRDYARDALQGAERVRSIVRDLRTFSRGDEEKVAPVEIEKALDSAINMSMSHIRPRAQLVREFAPTPAVLADESRLGQVFLNLLVNAAQAIPEGAPANNRIVARTLTGPSGEAVVEVEDTGCGIEPWKLERIFEPFWTDKPVGVGTGLGLSIVHGIVAALDGEITVRSEPGRGSVFRVSLPGRAAQPQLPAAEKPAPPRTGRRPRLLLIDDEAHLGITLTTGLREAVDVVSVRGGREAVRLLASGQEFDLILCDLMMPDLTGMDVYEEVSHKRPELGARFVFMTGGAVTERARRFLEQVPQQRLDKPFRLEQVESLLRRPAT